MYFHLRTAIHVIYQLEIVVKLVFYFLVSVPAEVISQRYQQHIGLIECGLLPILIC